MTEPIAAGASVELDLSYTAAFAVREQFTLHVEASVAAAASPADGSDEKVGTGQRVG